MFTVRQLGEKVIEKNKRMLMVCVDLEEAYDKGRQRVAMDSAEDIRSKW